MRSPSNAPTSTFTIAFAALATASMLAIPGCGSSTDNATSTTSTTRQASASGSCPGPVTIPAYRLNVKNSQPSQDIEWKFSGVDCFDWRGRTPASAGNTPLKLTPGAAKTLPLDVNCKATWPKWTATLYQPSSPRPELTTVRLAVQNGQCKNDRTRLAIWQGGAWKENTTVRVPTGGRSWEIGVSGTTLNVGLLP